MNDHGRIPATSSVHGMLAVLHPGIEPTRPMPADIAPAGPRLAPRLRTLRDKRLALFSNGKVNAGEIITAVGNRLQARHGIAEIRFWRKRHAGESGADVVPAVMAWQPDLVLTALGD